ncbi:MAG: redox-sensing transcriptional repressor Rex [Synergistaceae bacterium]|jgi:redox-sensing transcriptional repressor|nr:redox-sensing transcriptional repressor Rex [Synergistaceae bacterium]
MKVAEPTIERLVQYYRLLELLHEEGRRVVSSQEIGEMLSLKASQVRKDLSYFGEIGKRGVGYHVEKLYEHIKSILSTPRLWRIALVGVGRLGEALLGHKAFQSSKFKVLALFDIDPGKIGRSIMGIPCYPIEKITEVLREQQVEILILTVPSAAAQGCVDRAVASGTIRGILSFAQTAVIVPKSVLVYHVDIATELEKLLFFLKQLER